jgi:hypothetical protein
MIGLLKLIRMTLTNKYIGAMAVAGFMALGIGESLQASMPKVAPGSVIFGCLGLVIAIGSRKALTARLIRVRAKQ